MTCLSGQGPIFWTEARGANVRDADGNVFVDLTAGFGVASAGHGDPRVRAALTDQAGRLMHGLGDVQPAEIKVRLLEKLAELAPGDLGVTVLASSGAEAVEAALKTALLQTGRPGVLAFEGSYHGLTYGALAVTWPARFREPFRAQLYDGVQFAPFAATPGSAATSLDAAARIIDEAESGPAPIGAVIVEPVQGRGGLVVPDDGFLEGLRALCDGRSRVLIFDEIYTGFGRTGRWFACEHWAVVPDVITLGKALSGSLPLSGAIGTAQLMMAWPASSGEALHTSTFLGNPLACAAALAQISAIEQDRLLDRAVAIGARVRERAEAWVARFDCARATTGLGGMQGVVLTDVAATEVCAAALENGVIVLAEGPALDVLAITPPLAITDAQLDYALGVIEAALARAS